MKWVVDKETKVLWKQSANLSNYLLKKKRESVYYN